MARVSIDKKALTDPRFVRLGSHFVNTDDFIDGCDGTHGDVALNDLQRAFGGPPAFPTAFVIARDGTICSQYSGLAPLDQIERQIKALL